MSCNSCNNCNSCNSCNSCGFNPFPGFFPPWLTGCWNCDCGCDFPHSRWRHPIQCTPAYFSCAGTENGPTLVIHHILLEAGGEQSCTPRNFRIRVTGPSYPCGEIFTLRSGSCVELDEPLVISGLEAGQYEIEILYDCPRHFISTITGPVCSGVVTVADSTVPTVVTIVSRRRSCRQGRWGCSSCNSCNSWNNWGYWGNCNSCNSCNNCNNCNNCNSCC